MRQLNETEKDKLKHLSTDKTYTDAEYKVMRNALLNLWGQQ